MLEAFTNAIHALKTKVHPVFVMESRGPNGNRFSTVPADPGGRLKRSSSEASTVASDTASNHKSRESAKIVPSIPFQS